VRLFNVGRGLIVAPVALALLGGSAPLRAQPMAAHGATVPASDVTSVASGYRVSVGERATYDVEYKGRGVGNGSLEVLSSETTDGHPTYHAALRLDAGFLFAKVSEQFDTWFDPYRFVSRRFSQNQRELTHTRKKNYEIAPERGIFRETYSGDVDSLTTNEPLDDISFLFYVRTLPLRVGEVDTIPRYFKSGREVIIRVLRKDTVTVPAGTFSTIVVQPTITNANGLFSQGGQAEVYLSDDAARTVVMLKSHVPVMGSVALTLREASTSK